MLESKNQILKGQTSKQFKPLKKKKANQIKDDI